ncbi:hypothetical protein QP222_05710 [Corynebacterium pyruviciproducens]|nr:hypothetical protein [Corynebacterium pyruviciproducens]
MQKFTPQDLTQYTYAELDEYEKQLNNELQEIWKERDRRRALPFIQARETQLVKDLRAALGKPAHVGVDDQPPAWKKPTSVIDAFIKGDRVEHKKSIWAATGDGIIRAEPGVTDPVSGDVWEKFTPDTTSDGSSADAGATERAV